MENGACFPDMYDHKPKLHVILSNYPLWEKRMKEVKERSAVIDLFYWQGKPATICSKQVVFATLDKDSGVGIQTLFFDECDINKALIADSLKTFVLPSQIAKNDGLSLEDFKAWFKGYDLSEPMAIIHFTKFRY